MVRPCISRTTSEHFQSKRLGLECVPKHKEHTSSKITKRIFIPSCDRKKKKIKNEIQIGLEVQNSNLSALVYTAAMVYTVVYTAAAIIAKKSAKNRAGGAKLPPRYFGKPACCTMVPKHPDTLKTPTLPYVHTPLPPKFWSNMCMHVMGGCQAGKAQRKCEHGPGNRPGPLLFLKFSIIPGQINKCYFWSAAELVRAWVAGAGIA